MPAKNGWPGTGTGLRWSTRVIPACAVCCPRWGWTVRTGFLWIWAFLPISSTQPRAGSPFKKTRRLICVWIQAWAETAKDLVNRLPADELAEILWKYGEERYSRRIAERIERSRRTAAIETTKQLADIIASAIPAAAAAPEPATPGKTQLSSPADRRKRGAGRACGGFGRAAAAAASVRPAPQCLPFIRWKTGLSRRRSPGTARGVPVRRICRYAYADISPLCG